MKIPKLKIGGLYLVAENGVPHRIAIRGYVPGTPIQVGPTTFVYVKEDAIRRIIG